jgi:hypothetical protein
MRPEARFRWSDCERLQRRPPERNRHWAEAVSRPQRVLQFAAVISAALTAILGVLPADTGIQPRWALNTAIPRRC